MGSDGFDHQIWEVEVLGSDGKVDFQNPILGSENTHLGAHDNTPHSWWCGCIPQYLSVGPLMGLDGDNGV